MADLTKPTEADHTSLHRQEVDKPGCKTFFYRCNFRSAQVPSPKLYVVDQLHSEGLQLLNTRELALKAAQEIFQGLPLFPSWPKKCKGIVFVGKQQSNKYSLCVPKQIQEGHNKWAGLMAARSRTSMFWCHPNGPRFWTGTWHLPPLCPQPEASLLAELGAWHDCRQHVVEHRPRSSRPSQVPTKASMLSLATAEADRNLKKQMWHTHARTRIFWSQQHMLWFHLGRWFSTAGQLWIP